MPSRSNYTHSYSIYQLNYFPIFSVIYTNNTEAIKIPIADTYLLNIECFMFKTVLLSSILFLIKVNVL